MAKMEVMKAFEDKGYRVIKVIENKRTGGYRVVITRGSYDRLREATEFGMTLAGVEQVEQPC